MDDNIKVTVHHEPRNPTFCWVVTLYINGRYRDLSVHMSHWAAKRQAKRTLKLGKAGRLPIQQPREVEVYT